MCGISGVLHLDGQPADPQLTQAMIRTLAHRGPDGEETYTRGRVGLGHRRLSIVDLSAHGTQPMSNEDGTVWITFNGEIYNHQDLRTDLEQHGHRFTSRTDTEAIIHGYEEYGAAVLERLNGMFAFAIWDGQRLFLARDRIGIKPLFYGIFGNTFLFGSEIKAILAHPAATAELEPDLLDLYLSLNYTPAPYTLFKNIRQLEPGCYLRIDTGQPEVVRYWDVDYGQQREIDFAAAQDEFDALLRCAVQRRLMSDVPLGAFLSGGVDSSAVVSYMSGDVKTFSIGFGESSYNEAPYARQVADHLKTTHHEQIVTPELASIVPKIVWHGEDPLADSSMIPVYYLAQMTRERVTVALAGDGADEILAGYPTYLATRWSRYAQFLPRRLMTDVAVPLIERLPVSDAKISRREKLLRFANGLGLHWKEAHAVWRQIHTDKQKRAILTPGLANGRLFETYHHYYDQCSSDALLNQLLYVDTRFYLPNDMLVKVDRMTMAHGLEARVPFLDHEVVEFLAQLPPHYKLQGNTGKYILRQVMADRLPESTLTRPKAGFNIPAGKWLREDLRDLLRDALAPNKVSEVGVFQTAAVQKMIEAHERKQADYGYQLWGLLTFMLWWEQFIR